MRTRALKKKLIYLYGKADGLKTAAGLERLINRTEVKDEARKSSRWDEKDIALIAYPDSFQEKGIPPLKTLNKFLRKYIGDRFKIVHVLPFYPYSSDRGFAIIDAFKVNHRFGSWADIKQITQKYRLVADLVTNHVSVKNRWFQEFLKGNPKYKDFFIWFSEDNLPPKETLQIVRRGRAAPLLTPFKTKDGFKYLWTTYSVGETSDQIDLNYHNPAVLIEEVRVLLNLIKRGARLIRLDGVGGLWKELGTICKHLPQTHELIKIFRMVVDATYPSAIIMTETTTATYEERIRYLSDQEASVIYNFDLAPLILYSFYSNSVEKLANFIKRMRPPSKQCTYFNILDIHDGINVYSVNHLLNENEMQLMYDEVTKRGGVFSYRNLANGEKGVKEMQITWWSAINERSADSFELQLQKFLTSRAIALSLAGIPAIYYLSLFGSQNDSKAYDKTRHGRDINRTNFSFTKLQKQLVSKNSRESKIFAALTTLIERRKLTKAFHPDASQAVLNLNPRVLAFTRGTGKEKILALFNFAPDKVEVRYKGQIYKLDAFAFIWQNAPE